MLLRERMGYNLRNAWVGGNLDELTHEDRQGSNDHSGSFVCRLQWRSCRYQMRYTRGVETIGDMRGRLSELQLDKVAVQIDIPTMQLEDEEIAGDLRAHLRRELGEILERWESD